MAATKSVRARNLRFKNEEIGMIAESTSRYPVVTHCTVAVFTPNSSMSTGKATFIAVSTASPANDMMPTATMETTRHASRRRSNPDTLSPLFSHPGHDCGAKSRRSTIGPMASEQTPGTTHRYTHGHGAAVLASHSRRTAQDSAGYLLPHLRQGMNLLDVGCGPASVTADLAELVAPGRVVGLDASPAVLDVARALLTERGLRDRVELMAGDVFALPFDDDTFDVIHAHQLLQHLNDPVAALAEMRRVVHPGGIVAARDAVYSADAWFPQPAGMDSWLEVYMATARANGGEPDAGSRLLAWSRAAGFREVTTSASAWCFATEQDREWWSGTWAERCLTSFGPRAVELGLATTSDLETMAEAWRQWGTSEDGWFVVVHGEVLLRA